MMPVWRELYARHRRWLEGLGPANASAQTRWRHKRHAALPLSRTDLLAMLSLHTRAEFA
jgi:hypothetical protein